MQNGIMCEEIQEQEKKKKTLWLYNYEIKFLEEIQPNWELE
jgi:hypothetical protein